MAQKNDFSESKGSDSAFSDLSSDLFVEEESDSLELTKLIATVSQAKPSALIFLSQEKKLRTENMEEEPKSEKLQKVLATEV